MLTIARGVCLWVAVLAAPHLAAAATGTWNVDTDGSWTSAGNWSGSTIADGIGFTANFTNNITTTRTITVNSGRVIGNLAFSDAGGSGLGWILTGGPLTLDVSSGSAQINTVNNATIGVVLAGNDGITKIGGGTLTFTAANTYTGGTTISAGTLQIGNAGSTGVLGGGNVVNSGTLAFNRTNAYTYGGNITGAGRLVQRGTGTTLLTGLSSYSGATSVDAGTLHIAMGGSVVTSSLGIAMAADMNGTVIVSDPGSQLTLSTDLYVGQRGNGTLRILDGASVSAQQTHIGQFADSQSTVTVSGANAVLATATYLRLGNSGSASLNVLAGGSATSDVGYVGFQPGSNATVLVSGNGSRWTNSNNMVLGIVGSGEIEVAAGGLVQTRSVTVGSNTTAVGTLLVTGATSQFESRYAPEFGYWGTATLTVADGGRMSNTSNGIAYLGRLAGATGRATVSGHNSHWEILGDLRVGDQGFGLLTVADGGQVSNGYGYVGYSSASNTATVSGANSRWTNANQLTIGHGGQGSVFVTDGGSVTASTLMLGDLSIGSGTLAITGVNSRAVISETARVGNIGVGHLSVADQGSLEVGGVLHVQNGSTLTIDGGSVTARTYDRSSGNLVWNDGTLTISGGTYTHATSSGTAANILVLDGTSGAAPALALTHGAAVVGVEAFVVGASNGGRLTIADGSVLTATGSSAPLGSVTGFSIAQGRGEIGLQAGSSGTATITGGGSQLVLPESLVVGRYGNGTLEITDGGYVSQRSGVLGQAAGSSGVATVSGTGSRWAIADAQPAYTSLSVGQSGSGVLEILAGGEVTSFWGYLGLNSGGSGQVVVHGAGSQWLGGDIAYVGASGDGQLLIQSGGSVRFSNMDFGNSATGHGSAVIQDAGSELRVLGRLGIGISGTGNLTVTAGGTAVSRTGNLGSSAAGRAEVLVSGEGSRWTLTNSLYVGGSSAGIGGTGSITVADGGSLVAGDTLKLWNAGTLAVNGGNVTTRHFDRSLGTVAFNDGTLTISGGVYTHAVGSDAAANILTLDGATSGDVPTLQLTHGASTVGIEAVVVGGTHGGSLVVSGGSTLASPGTNNALGSHGGSMIRSGHAYLGAAVGSSGEALVTGGGSTWTSSHELHVGERGAGALVIADGGHVRNHYGYLGYHSTATGSADIGGLGSQWSLTGGLMVGYSGNATLTIHDGGKATSAGGFVAYGSGSAGEVVLTGTGSQWNMIGDMMVAHSGTGTLRIEDGAAMTSGDGYLGFGAMGQGAAIVTGLNSTWSVTNELFVGYAGSGHLTIQDGGQVSAAGAQLGFNSAGNGTATVSGSDSLWSMSSALVVGHSGTGTLNVLNSAEVANNYGYVGYSTNGTGTATITGADSQWSAGQLSVGQSGRGTIYVEAGGRLLADSAMLGANTGTGIVTVSGLNSRWTTSGSVNVGGVEGNSGTGIVNVGTGGAVEIGNALTLQPNGTLNLDGGSVTARSFDRSLGTVAFDSGSLTVSGGTYTHATGTNAAANVLTINGSGTPLFQLTQGAVAVGVASVVVGSTDDGELRISSGSMLTNLAAPGTLDTIAGRPVNGATAHLGHAVGASGTATVEGTNSQWELFRTLYVGGAGSGSLTVTDGGRIQSGSGYLGDESTGVGTAVVSGANSVWSLSTQLRVGVSGTGSLNVENGGRVQGGSVLIGTNAGGVGTMTVGGSGSTMNFSSIFAGYGGLGELHVVNGGSVTSGDGYVGFQPSGVGSALVSGPNSNWTVSTDLNMSGSQFSTGGAGSLTVADGGTVNVGNLLKFWNVGTMTVDGGSVTARSFDRSLATLNFHDGTITVSGGTYTHATGSGSAANILALDGATPGDLPTLALTHGATAVGIEGLVVGLTNEARIDVSGGSVLSTGGEQAYLGNAGSFSVYRGYATLGAYAGSTGTVSVSGTGSQWHNTGPVYLGQAGDGVLEITSGGAASSQQATLGLQAASTATALVSGIGSQWTVTNDMYVGSGGQGSLRVDDGGSASANFQYVGYEAGSTGVVTVSGLAANLLTSNVMNLGYDGHGTLNVAAGGTVTSNFAQVGTFTTGVGAASVTGAGSQWNGGDFVLGNLGSGSLTIADGGSVAGNWITLGNYAVGSGTLDVTGTNSQLTAATALLVGQSGTGNLNVAAGGRIDTSMLQFAGDEGVVGTGSIVGAGSQVTATNSLVVGLAGSGNLLIADGGHLFVGYQPENEQTLIGEAAFGGDVTGVGTATVSGRGSHLTGNVVVGSQGRGTLRIENEGTVAGAYGIIAGFAGSVGDVVVTGAASRWTTTGTLFVATEGQGTLTIESSGFVESRDGSIASVIGGSGAVHVSGAGSAWLVNRDLYVANSGTGSLNIDLTGLVFTASNAHVAARAGAVGAATITNADWIVGNNLNIGGTNSVSGGAGTVNVNVAGTLAVGNRLKLWTDDVLNVDGGTVTTRDFDRSAGILNFSDGTITVSGGTYTHATGSGTAANILTLDGGGPDALPTLALAHGTVAVGVEGVVLGANHAGRLEVSGGSILSLDNEIYLGVHGRGELYVADGGSVVSSYSALGVHAGSEGIATITGPQSQWITDGNLNLSSGGSTATLTVANGGSVVVGFANLGDHLTGFSTAHVTGAGSTFTSTQGININHGRLIIEAGGTYSDVAGSVGLNGNTTGSASLLVTGTGSRVLTQGTVHLGTFGPAFLRIEDQGVIESDSASFGGVSTAVVTGVGSRWTMSNDLINSYGSLLIEAGGLVENQDSRISREVDGLASVIVTGTGSQWNNSGSLHVGDRGQGTLEVGAYATVTTGSDAYIAGRADSIGDALVTGTSALWMISNDLYVGGRTSTAGGTGLLTIESGGRVEVGGLTKIWQTGSVVVAAGGTFHTGTLDVVTGGRFEVLAGGSFSVDELQIDEGGTFVGDIETTGNLVLNGTLEGNAVVQSGDTLGGSGVIVGIVSGAGTVGPGNSPGVLDAVQIDATSGIDFLFEFTAANTVPDYLNRTASVNDVLHVTDATTPFLSAFTPGNTITVDFQVASLFDGDAFLGGFFTNQQFVDFYADGTIDEANYAYLLNGSVLDANLWQVTVSTIEQPGVDFGVGFGGVVDGRVMQFQVSAVPEPGSFVLAGAAAAAGYVARRRKQRQAAQSNVAS